MCPGIRDRPGEAKFIDGQDVSTRKNHDATRGVCRFASAGRGVPQVGIDAGFRLGACSIYIKYPISAIFLQYPVCTPSHESMGGRASF